MWSRFTFYTAFIIAFTIHAIAFSAHDPNAEDVLRGYERSVSIMTTRISFAGETETTNEGDFNWDQQTQVRDTHLQ
jgi:hypothetical protein